MKKLENFSNCLNVLKNADFDLADNNTDLSSYFTVDKKKVLCYTKFTK